VSQMSCHPDRSEAQWRYPLFSSAATEANGSNALPFVIPSVPWFPARGTGGTSVCGFL
jgi:hypothetical protein